MFGKKKFCYLFILSILISNFIINPSFGQIQYDEHYNAIYTRFINLYVAIQSSENKISPYLNELRICLMKFKEIENYHSIGNEADALTQLLQVDVILNEIESDLKTQLNNEQFLLSRLFNKFITPIFYTVLVILVALFFLISYKYYINYRLYALKPEVVENEI